MLYVAAPVVSQPGPVTAAYFSGAGLVDFTRGAAALTFDGVALGLADGLAVDGLALGVSGPVSMTAGPAVWVSATWRVFCGCEPPSTTATSAPPPTTAATAAT